MNQNHYFNQPDFNDQSKFKSGKRLKRWGFVLSLCLIAYAAFVLGTRSNTIEVTNPDEPAPFWQRLASIFSFDHEFNDPEYKMPTKEENRFDVLILGIRGENDPDAKDGGALLTDTIIVLSFDETTKKSSLISIPRDLYLKIDKNKKNKINTAYEYGYYHKSGGLNFVKDLVSRITGIYIDKVVVLDFSSFEKIIDQVGGIDIVLAKPFEEAQQWGYKFSLPAGKNHLNGKDALYYARSRFSSSDFDRSRRQQEVMFALKDKLSNLNLLTDPIKTISVLNTIRSNIKTDINIWNTKEIINLAREIDSSKATAKYTITTENLVYESRIDNAYVLLPKGDNLTQIKELFKSILN